MAHPASTPLARVALTALTLAVAASAPGCAYDEGLLINNLHGRVFVPKEAVSREIVHPDGSIDVVEGDIKLLGPVYLGLYPSVFGADVIERYPHPEVGPQFQEGVLGNTYPYGGTSVGDLRFPCLEFLVCKVSSGRFLDYQEIVDWFEFIDLPILDAAGAQVQSGDFLAQTCYDLLDVTTDDEVRITAFEDTNGDDVLDLDFVDDGDYFVADFTIWQQEFFWDQNQEDCTPGVDCKGFSLWGWMDAPSTLSYTYSTCNPTGGFENREYNADFEGGAAYSDLLNYPSSYITEGDWVSSTPFQWDDVYEEPDIYLDFAVQ